MDDKLPSADMGLAQLAGAIAEPARARMLCSLLDGHARTATELAALAEVGASTASAHLARLRDDGLLSMLAQGKHRYYRLASAEVGQALEALLVVAGVAATPFTPTTPDRLRHARTCYDHMAGTVAVALHDQLQAQGWLLADGGEGEYRLSASGAAGMAALGIDVPQLQRQRRRFACACLDWSERRAHLGGALGAAILQLALRQRWAERELDSRALRLTPAGERRLLAAFGGR
ncbi:ArsR/SmtB family transcription factor [Janthinobacterium lividum]|uniref:ArsR/SmtB family transcription factor n=1 Tax=Janthinobacterium lividum TaxID=29581 RepID=UPI000874844B|nr:ArsR family transcriptional regulator [Janthinobacterium lividum]MCC7715855.1 helix-turn-helix transcriptional regulator [Janthinobacterium lividum]OEZ52922.1 helix-turn-helix domain protein [Janthinobacterium lividum]WQE29879.1 ArsR family transcriptional regulator [Janthinobacterium lividum]STQ95372.1 Helix-turn-helix domain [Janthinobacterium lividum]